MGELRACPVTDVTLEKPERVDEPGGTAKKVTLGYVPVQSSVLKNARNNFV